MTGRVKLKGKHKRGERGSVEEEQQSLKRANMADEEEVCSTNDKEVPNTDSEETVQQRTNIEETSLSELKEMLVDIQITVSDILRQKSKLTNEVTELWSAFHQQKTELTAVKTTLSKMMKQQDDLETELVAARKRISEQEDEIVELYDLQDDLEQYTRKNSLEIHGVPESAYTSTEEVVLKLAGAIKTTWKFFKAVVILLLSYQYLGSGISRKLEEGNLFNPFFCFSYQCECFGFIYFY